LQQDIITHPAIINLTPEQQKLTGAKALTDIAPMDDKLINNSHALTTI
jgi:hypothetical protein